MRIFGSGLTKEFGFGVWLVSRYLSLPDGWMRGPLTHSGPDLSTIFYFIRVGQESKMATNFERESK